MIKLKINNKEVQADKGMTIMQAAETAGIEIPSLCYLKGLAPSTSCMVCVVELEGSSMLQPSCSAEVMEGMVIETSSDRVQSARKTALELLLSEHAGDCVAPCQMACPKKIDIPRMIRKIQQGNIDAAAEIVYETASGPDIKCNKQCEKACRRKQYDEAVSICSLVSFVKKESGEGQEKKEDHNISKKFNSLMRKITGDEMDVFLNNAAGYGRVSPQHEKNRYGRAEAVKESFRCLHCDCRKKDSCGLRDRADLFQAQQIRYSGERTGFSQLVFKDYIFEQGKCIKCGICVGISEKEGIKYGFAFMDRGFNSRVGVPFNRYENPELKKIIDLLINNCPTGALARNDSSENEDS